MDKPITKIAADATHGNEDVDSPTNVDSPTKYVNKMSARSATMIHENRPKAAKGLVDGEKAAKDLAALNTTPIPPTDEEECGEGLVKDEKGQCVEEEKDLTIETGDTGGGGTGDLEVADQSGDV